MSGGGGGGVIIHAKRFLNDPTIHGALPDPIRQEVDSILHKEPWDEDDKEIAIGAIAWALRNIR